MAATGVAPAVTEPPLALVAHHQAGRVVDAAVAAGRAGNGLEAVNPDIVVIVLELELPACLLPDLLVDGELGDVVLQLGLAGQSLGELVVLALAVHPDIPVATFY